MKLFVWNFNGRYEGGMVCAMAKNAEDAKVKAMKSIGENHALYNLVKNGKPLVSNDGVAELFWAE